jgi:integrase
MSVTYPKICIANDGKYFIDFNLNDKRYRLYNGNKIKLKLNPNSFPVKQRRGQAELLAKKVYDHVVSNNYSFDKDSRSCELALFDRLIESKLSENLSDHYRNTLRELSEKLREQVLINNTIPIEFTNDLVRGYQNNTSFNTVRRHVNVLLNHLSDNGFMADICSLRPRKQVEFLHKPIDNLPEVLAELQAFNYNLYLCCLLTYGCLLRPHREIRLLRWHDFDSELRYVSVDGSRVKSRRNRIVPVPQFIRDELVNGNPHDNIFSNTPIEFNKFYFNKLWSRFKKQSKLIDSNNTIYSFRHSGAIDIFKRTWSINKLQKAMGHSSINVSLTYLRGLEVPELKEEDMPFIH